MDVVERETRAVVDRRVRVPGRAFVGGTRILVDEGIGRRRAILDALGMRPLSTEEIRAVVFGGNMSREGTSNHMKKLEEAGLVVRRKGPGKRVEWRRTRRTRQLPATGRYGWSPAI